MKRITYGLLAMFMLAGFTACDMNNESDSKEVADEQNEERFAEEWDQDVDFAAAAASGGLMEVELGTIAQQNAASAEVKNFGEMMVKDHSKANEELKSLTYQKDIEIPAVPSEEHQEKINKLVKMKGEEFDKEYMELMVKDHEEDIEKFKEQVEKGKDPQLQQWASEKIPVLEMHQDMAKKIHEGMK